MQTRPQTESVGLLFGPLVAVARVSVTHARATLVVAAILTLAALGAMTRLKLSVDILDTVPQGVSVAERLRSLADYGSIEPVILAISGSIESLDQRLELAAELNDRLTALDGVESVQGPFVSDPSALFDENLSDSLLLYLSPEDIDRLPRMLSKERIDRKVAENLRQLYSPLMPLTQHMIADDPLGMLTLLSGQYRDVGAHLALTTHDGIPTTEDGHYVLMLVRPAGSPRDLDFATVLLDDISAQVLAVLDILELQGRVGVGLFSDEDPITVGLTGHAAVVVDYRDLLSRDIRKISGVAFAAVLFLFWVAFKRPSAVIVAGVPLVVGVLWTLGIAALLIGRIDALTAAAVPVLCGLAIDFTIHLYNRYLEEIHRGHDTLQAFAAAHGKTGVGILAAALTTTWAFFALGLADLPGPRSLGRICAIGMPVCLAASLLLVPALTSVSARQRHRRVRPGYLAGFGLESLLRPVLRHPRTVLMIGALCTTLLGLSATRVGVRDGLSDPSATPSRRLLADISRRTGLRIEVIVFLIQGNSWGDVLERSARLERELGLLVREEGPLALVVGPSRLLPSPTRQQTILARLRRLREQGAIQPEGVERDLLDAMDRHGFRVEDRARRAASRVAALLSRDHPITPSEIRETPMGRLLKDMLIEHEDGSVTAIVSTYARPGVGSTSWIDALEAAVKRSGVAAEIVGSRVLSREIKPIAFRDAKKTSAIAALGIVAILIVTFRSVLLAAVTFIPVVAGGIGAIGLMPLFAGDLDVVGISMVPVILGIGIDDGIHIVQRFFESPGENLVRLFRHTGRGVVITSLTSIIGFGSMTFADSPGMASAGPVVIFGVGTTLVTSLTIVPAFLQLLRGRFTK